MNNSDLIIKLIDDYLENNNLTEITPNEASVILNANNVLKAYPSCIGLNLRNLLRDGEIPHAEYRVKPGNKRGNWFIPHS